METQRMSRLASNCKLSAKPHFERSLLDLLAFGWLLLWTVCSASPAFAVPAAPTIRALAQPDGRTFDARQWGDEWNHGWETTEGYSILRDEASRYWVYAVRDDTGKLMQSLATVLQEPTLADAAQLSKMPEVNHVQIANLQKAINVKKLNNLYLPFIANVGQINSRVRFYAQTLSGVVYISNEGEIVYSLPSEDGKRNWALVERFKHGKVISAGTDNSKAALVSFMKSENGRLVSHNATTFSSLTLGEVFSGVQVELHARGGNIEKIYTVAPGSDPALIRMSISGAQSLRLDNDGSLIVDTGNGPVRFSTPVAWQEEDGLRIPVRVSYVPDSDKKEYSFAADSYDKTKVLIIDPILQSTYLGGSAGDYGNSLAIHPISGDVYIVGHTGSTDFPGVSGGADDSCINCPNLTEVYVARFSSDLTKLLSATYLGGNGEDFARSIAIHPVTGDIYVAGYTNSSDFPGLTGGADTSRNPSLRDLNEAFVSKLSYDLTVLIQSTYLGGNGFDEGFAVAIHPHSGDIYLAGRTSSTDLPGVNSISADMDCNFCNDYHDGFIARLSGDLKTVLQSSYLGGTVNDVIYAIAIDATSGNIFVGGVTQSSDFPYINGGADINCTNCTLSGVSYYGEGFVTRFSQSLSNDGNVQSTYLGGNAADNVFSIAVHPDNQDVYVAGVTNSFNFPGVVSGESADSLCEFPSCIEPPDTRGARYEGFISWLTGDLKNIKRSTYLGGVTDDYVLSLAIESGSGDIYVTGVTDSRDLPGININSADNIIAALEAYVSRLTKDLKSISQSSYLGGSHFDYGYSLALDSQTGRVYIAGITRSSDFPNILGGADVVCNNCSILNNYEAFVSVLDSLTNQQQFNLSVLIAGAGVGTVTSNPVGVSCGISCNHIFSNGTIVILTTSAAAGSTFTGWSGACSGTSATCAVTMDAAKSVTATFAVISNYTLTVTKAGTGIGTVTSSPAGINCGGDCSESYPANTAVTLAATAAAGSTFAGWSGACSGAGGCAMTMGADRSVTATFDVASTADQILITRYYQSILGRIPDPTGLAY